MPPWITSRLTDSARARTQVDTDVCAAVLIVAIVVIHAAPPASRTIPAITGSRSTPRVALASATGMRGAHAEALRARGGRGGGDLAARR
jgi:FlaG/FlaF family flagellin (archaellin)